MNEIFLDDENTEKADWTNSQMDRERLPKGEADLRNEDSEM